MNTTSRKSNSQKTQVCWQLNWLMHFLPESCRADIIAFKILLQERSLPAEEVRKQMLIAILFSYKGFAENLVGILSHSIEKLSPRHVTQIYGVYGQEVIEEIEEEFILDHYRSSLVSMRASGILMILFCVFFAVLDVWCLPETRYIAWMIKLFICLILAVATFLSFYWKRFEKFHQEVISTALVSAGAGIALIIGASHPNEIGYNSYYAGLVILYFYVYLFSGLRYFYAVWTGIAILLCYELIICITRFSSIGTPNGFLAFVNNNLFLVMSLFTSITACNLFERSIRLNFLIRYAIATSFRNFLHFFEYQEPQKFLENLGKIRTNRRYLEEFLSKSYRSTKRLVVQGGLIRVDEHSLLLEAQVGEIKNSRIPDLVKEKNLYVRLKEIGDSILSFLKSIHPMFSQERFRSLNSKFLDEIESQFLKDNFQTQRRLIRCSIFYSIIFYGIFVFVDAVYLPETVPVSSSIRLYFCLYCTSTLLLSFKEKIFERLHQILIGIGSSIGGIGIVLMLAASQPTELGYSTYYMGLIQVLFYVFLFSGLLFKNAIIVGCLIVGGHTLTAAQLYNVLESPEKAALFINNSVFLVTACLIGTIACNFFERNLRSDFLTRYAIAYKAQELLAYYEHHKPTSKQLWDMINGIRHSPQKLEEFLMELVKFQRAQE